jgi:hypothetical protein
VRDCCRCCLERYGPPSRLAGKHSALLESKMRTTGRGHSAAAVSHGDDKENADEDEYNSTF